VVGAVSAAAGGQRCVVSIDRDRERSQTEEQNQQDRENAPHLPFMLHELCSDSRIL
jgi:hypothetical protein